MLFDPKRWTKPNVEPRELEPWRQILLDAAKHLRQFGWVNFSKPQTGLVGAGCVAMAVCAAAGGGHKGEPFVTALRQLAHHLGHDRQTDADELLGGIVQWNDRPGRRKQDVIAALEGAARS